MRTGMTIEFRVPVFQHTERRLCGGDGEVVGETLPVELHGGGDRARLCVFVRVRDDILDDDARVGRGHDIVREECALVISQAGVCHCCRRAGLASGQVIQVLAHCCLRCARPVREHDAKRAHSRDNCEDDDGDYAPLDAAAALRGHGSESDGSARRRGRRHLAGHRSHDGNLLRHVRLRRSGHGRRGGYRRNGDSLFGDGRRLARPLGRVLRVRFHCFSSLCDALPRSRAWDVVQGSTDTT